MSSIENGVMGRALAAIEASLPDVAQLLRLGVAERTIAAQVAAGLRKEFSGYDVDVEYNRHLLKIKSVQVGGKDVRVFPDIVVHKRGSDEDNLLVVEIKLEGRGTNEERLHDHEKLTAFVHGDAFRYRLGLFLELGLSAQSEPIILDATWYRRDCG